MIIKIDLEKAYDKLNWNFLEETLQDLYLPVQISRLIMQCVTSSSMKLLWNGTTTETFKPTHGIHQGDPLSPYLFVLCLERLAHAIQNAVRLG